MTDTVTIGKRARKSNVILTDRLCETRVDKRTKTYDRKCQGLYVSITTAGVAPSITSLPVQGPARNAQRGSVSATPRPSRSKLPAARFTALRPRVARPSPRRCTSTRCRR